MPLVQLYILAVSESCLLKLVLIDVFPISSSADSSRSSIFSFRSLSGRSAAREAARKMALLMLPPLISYLARRSKSTALSRGVSSGISSCVIRMHIIVYCLMPPHTWLMVKPEFDTLSLAHDIIGKINLRTLTGIYTQHSKVTTH